MCTMYINTKKTSGTIHTDPSTIGTEQITSVTGKTLDQIQNEIAQEKLKQEQIKTQEAKEKRDSRVAS